MTDYLILLFILFGFVALTAWAWWSKWKEWKHDREMREDQREWEIYRRGVRQGWADAERHAKDEKKREIEENRLASMTPEEIIEELSNELMSRSRPIEPTASSEIPANKKSKR
jgi:hypothetical protein